MLTPPSSYTSLRVAMSADSLIYAPFYLAVQRINAADNNRTRITLDFGASNAGFGDFQAASQLGHETDIDLVLCDPMAIVEHRSNNTASTGGGCIIACLVNRPALWLVVPRSAIDHGQSPCDQYRRGSTQDKHSLAHLFQMTPAHPVDLGRVVYYDRNSTAHYIIRHMIDLKLFAEIPKDKQKLVEMGGERIYLESTVGNSEENDGGKFHPDAVDTVVTCDVTHVYSAQFGHKTIFAWHKWPGIGNFPFTTLAMRRSILEGESKDENKLQASRLLLRELQKSVRDVIAGKDDIAAQAFLLKGKPRTEKNAPVRSDVTTHGTILGKLTRNGPCIYPPTISVTTRAFAAGWDVASSRFWNDRHNPPGVGTKQKIGRLDVTCAAPGRVAVPVGVSEKAHTYWHHIKSRMRARDYAIAGVLAPFMMAILIPILRLLFPTDTAGKLTGRLGFLEDSLTVALSIVIAVLVSAAVRVGLSSVRTRRG